MKNLETFNDNFFRFLGLDLSDSDDDATWCPFKAESASASAVGRHKRLASDDEDEFEYRNLVTTPKKQKKTNFFHTTTLGKYCNFGSF